VGCSVKGENDGLTVGTDLEGGMDGDNVGFSAEGENDGRGVIGLIEGETLVCGMEGLRVGISVVVLCISFSQQTLAPHARHRSSEELQKAPVTTLFMIPSALKRSHHGTRPSSPGQPQGVVWHTNTHSTLGLAVSLRGDLVGASIGSLEGVVEGQ